MHVDFVFILKWQAIRVISTRRWYGSSIMLLKSLTKHWVTYCKAWRMILTQINLIRMWRGKQIVWIQYLYLMSVQMQLRPTLFDLFLFVRAVRADSKSSIHFSNRLQRLNGGVMSWVSGVATTLQGESVSNVQDLICFTCHTAIHLIFMMLEYSFIFFFFLVLIPHSEFRFFRIITVLNRIRFSFFFDKFERHILWPLSDLFTSVLMIKLFKLMLAATTSTGAQQWVRHMKFLYFISQHCWSIGLAHFDGLSRLEILLLLRLCQGLTVNVPTCLEILSKLGEVLGFDLLSGSVRRLGLSLWGAQRSSGFLFWHRSSLRLV